MTKTIVVPLDGSATAEAAVAPAAWLAHRFGATLRLITTTFAEDVSGEEALLARGAAQVPPGDVTVETHVVRHFFPGSGITEYLTETDDAALCMSTRGKTGLGELLLGSVSDEVMREVDVPVVLVGPACQGIPDSPSCVVVCVDESDESATCLDIAGTWATQLELTAEVVLVADAHQLTSFPDETSAPAHRAAARLTEGGVAARDNVIEGIKPEDDIVAFAADHDAALIVLATHGRGGWSAKALGHIANDVVRHSPCPVLVRRIPKPS